MRGVVSYCLAQQRLERGPVDPVSFAEVDRPPLVPAQAGVEELPIHFHSSTTGGSTSWMILRISANLSPLQSPRLAILSSIRSEALIRPDDAATVLRDLAAFAAAPWRGPRCAGFAR